MAYFMLSDTDCARLQEYIKQFQSNAEKSINEVFHNEGSQILQEEIRRLMPVSGKTWNGKLPPARMGNSLRETKGNLYIKISSQTKYNYLYFPNDGTNTNRHSGEQYFFEQSGENKQKEIVDRCISRIVGDFNE